jgi:hypothetical protein
MRARTSKLIAALALIAAIASPAGARDNAVSAERAVANILISSLAPSSHGDWAYNWGAVSARVSMHMHWHLFEPDPRDRPEDYEARRNGWVSVNGDNVGISAIGGERDVTRIEVTSHRFNGREMVAALQAEGADVRFQGDDESGMEYWVQAPDRRPGVLRTTRVCTSPQSAAAQRCRHVFVLTFVVGEY